MLLFNIHNLPHGIPRCRAKLAPNFLFFFWLSFVCGVLLLSPWLEVTPMLFPLIAWNGLDFELAGCHCRMHTRCKCWGRLTLASSNWMQLSYAGSAVHNCTSGRCINTPLLTSGAGRWCSFSKCNANAAWPPCPVMTISRFTQLTHASHRVVSIKSLQL